MSSSEAPDVLLQWVKARTWFYEFDLPDGGKTSTDTLPEIQQLHHARRKAMLSVLSRRFADRVREIDCIDLGSHEGWFSLHLARHTRLVRGFDVNRASVEAAGRMCLLQGISNVSFETADIRKIGASSIDPADFVLLYGLIYHAEDPISMLRLAAQLARDTLLIETQITGWEFAGSVEFGHPEWRKPVLGWFALIDDDSNREGGNTGIALVPSLQAISTTLMRLGFVRIETVSEGTQEAEQFRRGQRAIIAAYRF